MNQLLPTAINWYPPHQAMAVKATGLTPTLTTKISDPSQINNSRPQSGETRPSNRQGHRQPHRTCHKLKQHHKIKRRQPLICSISHKSRTSNYVKRATLNSKIPHKPRGNNQQQTNSLGMATPLNRLKNMRISRKNTPSLKGN